MSGELKTQMATTTNIAIVLKSFDERQIKGMLDAAGHSGWYRVDEAMTREQRGARIWQLLQKAGGIEAFRPVSREPKTKSGVSCK